MAKLLDLSAARNHYDDLMGKQPVKHGNDLSIMRSRAVNIANWYALKREGRSFALDDRDDYVAQDGDPKKIKTRQNEWALVRTYLGAATTYDTKAKRVARAPAAVSPSIRPAQTGALEDRQANPYSAAQVVETAKREKSNVDLLTSGFLEMTFSVPEITDAQRHQLTSLLVRLSSYRPENAKPLFTEAEAGATIIFLSGLPVTAPRHRQTVVLAIDTLRAIGGRVPPATPATAPSKGSKVVSTHDLRCEHLSDALRAMKAGMRFVKPDRLQAVDRVIDMLKDPSHDRVALADELIALDQSLFSIAAVHRTLIVRMVDSIKPNSGIALDLTPGDRYDNIRGGKNEWPACIPVRPDLMRVLAAKNGRVHWIDFVYACAWSGIGPLGQPYDHKREETLETMACIWDMSDHDTRRDAGHFMGGLVMTGNLPGFIDERLKSGRWGFPEYHRVLWMLRYSVGSWYVSEYQNFCNPKGQFPDWGPAGCDGYGFKDWIARVDKEHPQRLQPQAYRDRLNLAAQVHYDSCLESFNAVYAPKAGTSASA